MELPERLTCRTWPARVLFAAWNEPGAFERVYVDSWGAVAWSEDIDLLSIFSVHRCYRQVCGKR